jgi:hypothetical protein
MAETHRTPIGTIWLDETGLLWHRLDAGVAVSFDDVQATVGVVRSITGGKPVPAVVDIRGAAFADRAARDGFAGDEESSAEIATALVVDNAFSRRLGDLFLRWSTPDRPVRMFTSEEEAAAWARTFLSP